MRNPDTFEFNARLWLAEADIRNWPAEEYRAYHMLLCYCAANRGLETTPAKLAVLINRTTEQFKDVWSTIGHKFTKYQEADGTQRLWHPGMRENHERRNDLSEKRKYANKKRWDKYREEQAQVRKAQPADQVISKLATELSGEYCLLMAKAYSSNTVAPGNITRFANVMQALLDDGHKSFDVRRAFAVLAQEPAVGGKKKSLWQYGLSTLPRVNGDPQDHAFFRQYMQILGSAPPVPHETTDPIIHDKQDDVPTKLVCGPEQRKKWEAAKAQLRDSLDEDEYTSWIEPAQFGGMKDGAAYLIAPSAFHGSWLQRNYRERIAEAFGVPDLPINFIVKATDDEQD